MKRIISLFAALTLLLLASCASYKSSYNAILLVHSNTDREASMSFMEFEGTMVFKLKCDVSGRLSWNGELESGEITVSIDNGGRSELFSASSGDSIRGDGPDLNAGTVYIIVETNGKCKEGSFSFEIE